LLVFLSKYLCLAPLDENVQGFLQQLRVHPVEFYEGIKVSEVYAQSSQE
jgi:hypothetical protein